MPSCGLDVWKLHELSLGRTSFTHGPLAPPALPFARLRFSLYPPFASNLAPRGTATFDGMAIAYGALRRLVTETRCLCLFATHYHALAREFEHVNPFVALYHMACSVDNETRVTAIACRLHPARLFSHLLPSPNPPYSAPSPSQPQPSPVFGMWQYHKCLQVVTFLYRFLRGACSRSHGVHVARLAGLPARVLDQVRYPPTVTRRHASMRGCLHWPGAISPCSPSNAARRKHRAPVFFSDRSISFRLVIGGARVCGTRA